MSDYSGWAFGDDGELVSIPRREAPEGTQVWRVVCTDRGTHSAHLLGYVADRRQTDYGDVVGFHWPGARPRADSTRRGRQRVRAELQAHATETATAAATFRFRPCPTCNRDVRRTAADVARALDALIENDPACPRVIDITWLG